MSLIQLFKEEVKKQKKDRLGTESRTPLAFPTGLDLLDFKNGKAVYPGGGHKKYVSLGVTEGSYVMWIGPSGSGKAQPLYSKIYTPNGFTLMGNIKEGDEVLTPNGSTAKVTGIYPQGKIKNFRVILSDDSVIECNEEHLFQVYYKSRNSRTNQTTDKYEVKTLADIKQDYVGKNGKLKYYIPMTQSVKFNKKDISIDPYLLGALLGDGSFRNTPVIFTNSEQDVLDKLSVSLNEMGLELNKNNGKREYDYSIINKEKSSSNPLVATLKEYGLFNLKSEDKFIPENYKYNTEEVRLKVLQGLIDTDGSIEKNNNVYFYTVSKNLANDVQEIVQSLGGIARIKVKKSGYRKDGVYVRTLDTYRIYIQLPSSLCPFSSVKHAEKYQPRTKYTEPVRKIKNIEFIGYEEMQCIMIDSEEHLYLTDEFITTHNTTVALQSAFNIIRPYENSDIFHYDLENATDKTRVAKVANQSMEYINKHYFHKNTGISSESFYESIVILANLKLENLEKFSVHTGKYDENGEEIVTLAPTVVILDSLPMLVPEKITEEEELSGQMSRTSAAKMNAQVFRQIVAKLKEANIILYVINHITQRVEINPMVHSKPQVNFLKQG